MRPLPDLPVFDRADARAAGWSDSALTRAARCDRIRLVRRGLYAAVDADQDRVGVLAAVRAVSGSVASHRSALVLHGLPVVGRRPEHPEVTVPPTGTGDTRRALLHRATLAAADVTTVDRTPVTSVARTLVDVARCRATATAVAAADRALHRGLVTLDEIDDVVLRCWSWPGISRARASLALVDGRADSPLESISRLTIRTLQLPAPLIQPWLLDQHGAIVARLDFYWDEFGAAGEADGRSKYDDRDVLTAEKDRQEDLENLHLAVTRWGWQHAWRRPDTLRSRIEAGFARGIARDRSGLPRLWSIQPSEPVTGGEKRSAGGR